MPAAPSPRAGRAPRPARARPAPVPAADLPVARVVVDVPLAHLDRPFDYAVPEAMAETAVAGCRVRVRFAGRLVDGFLLERAATTDHEGRLAFLASVVSPEPVVTPEVAGLAREVADRYAGTLSDVLRLAVPPRHARVEAEPVDASPPLVPPVDPGAWGRYETGPAFLEALAGGAAPRAVWTALPGPTWPAEVATAVQATLAGGRGALVVVPDTRDVDRVDAALTAALGPGAHVALTSELGPAERYRRWLAVLRGGVRAVVGTRAATFAPVADLGLAVVWDDGDDLHAEPRAPYPHVRDVLTLRAHRTGAALLVGGLARTAEAERLVASGWARPLAAPRAVVRSTAPRVAATGSEFELARDPAARSARLPTLAWETARRGLAAGAPVLFQVPRRGYLPALSCTRCRAPARCGHCSGPLGRADGAPDGVPACRWCGRPAASWSCPYCSGTALRAAVVGARRTAEELGRAFPGVAVRTSGRDGVLADVPAEPALVVATPGAEPVADGGYAAAVLLDGWALLSRPDLRAAEETLRRWMAAAALVRPATDDGRVVVLADSGVPVVQALVRWDPATAAGRELADRVELGFPPATRMASVTGAPEAVAAFLADVELPPAADVLGPVSIDDGTDERALLRVPLSAGVALAAAVKAALVLRSARKDTNLVRVRLDPLELL